MSEVIQPVDTTATTPAPSEAAPIQAAVESAPAAEATKPAPSPFGAGDSEAAAVPADWPEDWRVKLAGGDEKLIKRLERFNSINDVLSSYLEAEKKIRSGKVKADLPKDATPEQMAAWRKDNGIPETPDGYDIKNLDGYVVGEADLPMVNKFLEAMHGVNAPPEVTKSALKAYYGLMEQAQSQRAALDKQAFQESRQELKSEWGAEYEAVFNNITGFLDQAPEDVRMALEGARLADGTPLGFSKSVMKWMADLSRQIYEPDMIVNGGGEKLASLNDEKSAIESKMGTKAYTDADRTRYTEIVDLLQRTAKRQR